MRKILYCILPIFLCSVLSCDRKRQSSEQDMKDSLAAAFIAALIWSTVTSPSTTATKIVVDPVGVGTR